MSIFYFLYLFFHIGQGLGSPGEPALYIPPNPNAPPVHHTTPGRPPAPNQPQR